MRETKVARDYRPVSGGVSGERDSKAVGLIDSKSIGSIGANK
jgi:hypothetical protein